MRWLRSQELWHWSYEPEIVITTKDTKVHEEKWAAGGRLLYLERKVNSSHILAGKGDANGLE
jgi:hypothetical protein